MMCIAERSMLLHAFMIPFMNKDSDATFESSSIVATVSAGLSGSQRLPSLRNNTPL